MTPSFWSVLLIFVLAPLGVAVLTTAVVLLLTSPTRRSVARPVVAANEESQDEDPLEPKEVDRDTSEEGDPP